MWCTLCNFTWCTPSKQILVIHGVHYANRFLFAPRLSPEFFFIFEASLKYRVSSAFGHVAVVSLFWDFLQTSTFLDPSNTYVK